MGERKQFELDRARVDLATLGLDDFLGKYLSENWHPLELKDIARQTDIPKEEIDAALGQSLGGESGRSGTGVMGAPLTLGGSGAVAEDWRPWWLANPVWQASPEVPSGSPAANRGTSTESPAGTRPSPPQPATLPLAKPAMPSGPKPAPQGPVKQASPKTPYFEHRPKGTTAQPKPFSPQLDSIIQQVATAREVDPNLVRAVIQAESGNSEKALSGKGAGGLMQLMPGTAGIYGLKGDAVFDPEKNVRAGTAYLADMLERYHGEVRLALAAYNAGPGAVKKHHGVPPYRETRDYIDKVLYYYYDVYGAPQPTGTPR